MAEKKDPAKKGRKVRNVEKVGRNRRLGDYLLQLLVVVTGILITFQGSAWIERSSQRRQAKEILAMVEDELTENYKELGESRHKLERDLEGMTFFARHIHDIRNAPRDSINLFLWVLGSGFQFYHSSNALEVLKTSTDAVNVMDKELLRKIFLCYDRTNTLLESINSYYKEKYEMAGAFYYSLDREIVEKRQNDDPYPFAELYLKNTTTGNFVLNVGENITMKLSDLHDLIKTYDETIRFIDEYIGKSNRNAGDMNDNHEADTSPRHIHDPLEVREDSVGIHASELEND